MDSFSFLKTENLKSINLLHPLTTLISLCFLYKSISQGLHSIFSPGHLFTQPIKQILWSNLLHIRIGDSIKTWQPLLRRLDFAQVTLIQFSLLPFMKSPMAFCWIAHLFSTLTAVLNFYLLKISATSSHFLPQDH